MLASLADASLTDPALVYEPKYDGIRAIVDVPAGGQGVRIWSRRGNDKTRQFPEIAETLAHWARTRRAPVVFDGEIVALDGHGRPAGFQQLQGRIHTKGIVGRRGPADTNGPIDTAFIAFDVLREGDTDLRGRPLTERRVALERLLKKTGSPRLRTSEQVRGDGRALLERARAEGWEGLVAKRADSRYRSGRRTPDWRKLKIVHEQEFVIGGWTEPRQSRSHFGALILGVHEGPAVPHRPLRYVAHVGTGFDERELARLMKRLTPLEQRHSPFVEDPPTNERPHWVKPSLVTQVKFSEWTADGNLRHPVYLGLRDDKPASAVRREPDSRTGNRTKSRVDLVEQLRALEDRRADGGLDLPGGLHLKVTNLHKLFWPALKLTKGDLFRYYATVAPFLLPAIADRPLVMKRLPNGITGKPFYQHRVEDAPPGVRVDVVQAAERRPQIVGGDLATLMYTTQLAAISQDPWFSRVGSPNQPDYAALDLDPAPGVAFARVLDVARWIHDELEVLDVIGVPKTSGADGLHVYIPLPPGTPYEAGQLFARIVATVVVQKHPKQATTERAVKARGSRVYVDCLQNALGKTLASAYSARASAYAGVSTPLAWEEVDAGVRREEFTIVSVPARLKAVGDLWAALRTSNGVDFSRVERYTRQAGKKKRV